MPVSGRIRRRLALAIVLTALIPVLVAVWLAETAVRFEGIMADARERQRRILIERGILPTEEKEGR